MIVEAKFDFGDQVKIDNGDIVGVIITISLQGDEQKCSYEVSWFHNGEMKSAWFYDWRLTKEGGM